jgi:hypothetical protein
VNSLRTLVEDYIHPLKSQTDLDVEQDDVRKMFSNVEIIHTFHMTFQAQLTAAVAKKENIVKVSMCLQSR